MGTAKAQERFPGAPGAVEHQMLIQNEIQKGGGRPCRGGLKIMAVFGLAAVVDQEDVLKAVCNQTLDHSEELVVRIQRWQNHTDLG